MRKQIFPSLILIGFGLYFFLQKYLVSISFPIFSWPTILVIVGAALVIQAYSSNDFQQLIPGILFVGLGIHFHLVQQWNIQFDLIGVIILFLALGFFLTAKKTKNGMIFFWIFLTLAIIQLFSTKLFTLLRLTQQQITSFQSLWPIILIILGGYLFIFKRK